MHDDNLVSMLQSQRYAEVLGELESTVIASAIQLTNFRSVLAASA